LKQLQSVSSVVGLLESGTCLSPVEPLHIFDSTDHSAVQKFSFINFRSCQSCAVVVVVVVENNLYLLVIPCYHDPVLHSSLRAL
jgi:hypothetical protein